MTKDQELEKALAEFLASKEADAFAENNYNEPMRCMEHGFKVGWEQRSEISPFERLGRFLADDHDDHDDEKSRKPVGELNFDSREYAFQENCHGETSAARLADYCNNKIREVLPTNSDSVSVPRELVRKLIAKAEEIRHPDSGEGIADLQWVAGDMLDILRVLSRGGE